jgi:hypothetical protein
MGAGQSVESLITTGGEWWPKLFLSWRSEPDEFRPFAYKLAALSNASFLICSTFCACSFNVTRRCNSFRVMIYNNWLIILSKLCFHNSFRNTLFYKLCFPNMGLNTWFCVGWFLGANYIPSCSEIMQPLYMYIDTYMCIGCEKVESQGFRAFLQGIRSNHLQCSMSWGVRHTKTRPERSALPASENTAVRLKPPRNRKPAGVPHHPISKYGS